MVSAVSAVDQLFNYLFLYGDQQLLEIFRKIAPNVHIVIENTNKQK